MYKYVIITTNFKNSESSFITVKVNKFGIKK